MHLPPLLSVHKQTNSHAKETLQSLLPSQQAEVQQTKFRTQIFEKEEKKRKAMGAGDQSAPSCRPRHLGSQAVQSLVRFSGRSLLHRTAYDRQAHPDAG